jgi:two-component system, chemotaxis family, CheB/CheR fusion protein
MTSDFPSQPPDPEFTEDEMEPMQFSTVEAPFPIVGIAASAGGLDAFTQLLSRLPVDTGMAFVLIQHLSPNHESLLAEILARVTRIPVQEVEDGMVVQPNQAYVIPPNTKMVLKNGALELSPREKVLGRFMPADAFLASLAVDCGHKAIAVVLSGTDGDGSMGLRAVKAAGGITFAQQQDTAQFEDMPNTAVATGAVDFVLPPEMIASELANLSQNPLLIRPLPPIIETEAPQQPEEALVIIFSLLRSNMGVDFSLYKLTTLDRRIQRRMLLYKMERLEDYAEYLQAHPGEIKALYEEFLIHVTHFFRDPEAFDLLKTQIFPMMMQNKPVDTPIRIWVPGCSTGEEVYSLAICLLEFLSDQITQPPVQIFATDISEIAIDRARTGIYALNQMVEVSPERRRRFFYALEGERYQISKAVRELCVFARQDLGSDPPFSNLDLISCRNVLIYMGDTLQRRIIPIFHYSLNPTGFLMLGTSESIGKYSELFTLFDRKYRLYAKKPTNARVTFSFSTSNYQVAKLNNSPSLEPQPAEGFDLQKMMDQLILSYYAPTSVVINSKMEVLHLRGTVDRYLKLSAGAANLNIFNLVRDGLLIELRAAIYQAQRQEMLVSKKAVPIRDSDDSRIVNLHVIPFQAPSSNERHLLVLFEEVPAIDVPPSSSNPQTSQSDLERENTRLRQELAAAIQERAATQEYLQAMILELEHTNQDLKVANEEILSSNEELQSTNEELETAKEEIQATNEELNTTNEELRSRNLELHRVNNDLTNLLASINIPILMLTNDLRIRRFTPMAQRLFNFIPSDMGRPLSDIRANLNIPDLEPLILDVLDTLSVKELEVQTQGGHWYALRIRPYRTIENQIDGVVLVLLDIDDLKRSATTLEAARNYAEAIVETVRVPLVVLESDLRINKANRAFYETFQVSPPETTQALIFDVGNGQWNIPELRLLLENFFARDGLIENVEIDHDFERIGQKTILLNGWRFIPQGDDQKILLAIEDITERQQFEAERSQLLSQEQAARQQAEAASLAKDEFLSNLSHELRNPLNTMLGWAQVLRTQQLDPATATRALEVMERSARTQAQLIEDLLDISRITSGRLHLNTQLIDLAPVVDDTIASMQLSADTKSIQIVSQLTSATVVGDVDRLQQVLWNLLSNAIKFTPSGGQVAVRLVQVEADGDAEEALPLSPPYAQITVSDTGQGIPANLLPYIFERFRQGDSSSTKTSQGLGLGLTIVRHIVELHGGTVQAESPGEGQGTTMTVRLPLRSQSAAVIAQPDEPEPTVTESIAVGEQALLPLTDLYILVVDDEIDSLDLMRWMLENAGAQVVAVASAREALAALTASPGRFDVLLADIGMPDEDGLALIRQVRALSPELGGQIPAAAITAYASDREQHQAIAAGFQRHMAKPIDMTQFTVMVADLAGRGRDESGSD